MAAWEDHLLPLLPCKDAARLGRTCKALRELLRGHFKDLGTIKMDKLQAALTTFPSARGVTLDAPVRQLSYLRFEALVEWLREGGRGGAINRVSFTHCENEDCTDFVHAALQSGALPSLKNLHSRLGKPFHRYLLTHGLVAGMHELRLTITKAGLEPQLAALGLVRQLPALAKLELEVKADGANVYPVQWPPFIPPSLKALRIHSGFVYGPMTESLLRALPGMLEASGARLERLEVNVPSDFEVIGDGLVHVAQALRCSSPTLKHFVLGTCTPQVIEVLLGGEDYAARVERLRVQWADVLAGLSACRELEVLVLPDIEVEPLFPPGTAFNRLAHLEICDYDREHPPDAGVMGLWELMALGGLPALAKLSVRLEGRWGEVDEVKSRMAPAFEAVAGTLTHLNLERHYKGGWPNDEVGYEVGMAVGKLRRIRDLALSLSEDGRAYHAFAQGLAASGGDRPLTPLWRVSVTSMIEAHGDLLASLILPSVRVFTFGHADDREALLTACGLRQAGYKHTWQGALSGPRLWCKPSPRVRL
jgi:hypothetical protein